ncbi:MAG: low temperature requirement protein A [Gemmatimonadales bacterium]
MAFQRWVAPPRLRLPGDDSEDRRATWLELFFDLVFAAAVADLGSELSDHFTPAGLGAFFLQFFLFWWAWTGHTFFSTRFDNDDLLHRVLTLGQVFLAAVMAVNASPDLMTRETAGFVAGYGGMRLLLAVQYGRVVSVEASRPLARRQRLGLTLAGAVWLTSAISPIGWRPWLWAVALVVELGTPLWIARAAPAVPVDPRHLLERFGLFTLILFGQSVVAIMAGMRQRELWTPGAAISALLGLALTFSLWWAYFDGLVAASRQRGPTHPSSGAFQAWIATHLPLCFGIAVVAVGIEHIIARDGAGPLGLGAPLLVAGLVTVVVTLGVLAATSPNGPTRSPGRILAPYTGLAMVVAPAAIYGGATPPVWMLFWFLAAGIVLNVAAGRLRATPE